MPGLNPCLVGLIGFCIFCTGIGLGMWLVLRDQALRLREGKEWRRQKILNGEKRR